MSGSSRQMKSEGSSPGPAAPGHRPLTTTVPPSACPCTPLHSTPLSPHFSLLSPRRYACPRNCIHSSFLTSLSSLLAVMPALVPASTPPSFLLSPHFSLLSPRRYAIPTTLQTSKKPVQKLHKTCTKIPYIPIQNFRTLVLSWSLRGALFSMHRQPIHHRRPCNGTAKTTRI